MIKDDITQEKPQRYNAIAILMHWVVAIAIIAMIGSGLIMTSELLEAFKRFELFQWHKSLGVVVIFLVTFRIIWRVTHKAPPLPDSIPAKEKRLAHLGHVLLYWMMVILPLSGWLLVSSSSLGIPTIVFGGPEWPHIRFVEGNESVHEVAEFVHEFGAYAMIVLIAGHIAAVVLHKKKHKENLLKRMVFAIRRDN